MADKRMMMIIKTGTFGFLIGRGVTQWKSLFHSAPFQQAGAYAAQNGLEQRRFKEVR